jgi:amidase
MEASPITDLDAHVLSREIHARSVSCREVMQAYLARIARLNPRHNAIVNLQPEAGLLAQADAHDALLAAGQSKGWLHGIPQAIKDISPAAGIACTWGSPLLANSIPTEDGLMASRMRAAGAIIIGKTNTPEFGLGSHTFNEVFGVTRNAFDASKTAGGSSGGAAVALALRLLPVADGSDSMGSLRNPAAFNHVFGMRPSQGRVPMWPVQDGYITQLGTEGPMGRCVTDVAMLLATQAGYDVRCPLALQDSAFATDLIAMLQDDTLSTHKITARIAWLGNLNGYLQTEPGILEVCEQGLQRLAAQGCLVEPAQLGSDPAAVAGVAQGAGCQPHCAAARQPCQPCAHQARGAVGMRPSRGRDCRRAHASKRCAQQFLLANGQAL